MGLLGNDSNWVHNVRAAGGHAVLRRRRRQPVLLEEVEVGARAPILRRYLAVAPGARPHLPVTQDSPLEAFAARILPVVTPDAIRLVEELFQLERSGKPELKQVLSMRLSIPRRSRPLYARYDSELLAD